MKKLLIGLTLILVLVQLAIVLIVNFYEKEFLHLSLTIANNKLEAKIDENYLKLKNSKFLKWGGIATKDQNYLDEKFDGFKEGIIAASQKVSLELESGLSQSLDIKDIKFDIIKLIDDKEYSKSYFKSNLHKSIRSLNNELNIVFGTNLLALFMILIIGFINYDHSLGKRLGWITLVSVILSCSFYFLNKNWFYTLLMDSHNGFIYSLFLGLMILILADIGINRGRIIGNIFMSS